MVLSLLRLRSLSSSTRRVVSAASSLATRSFHRSALTAFPQIPFKLADIGEGIAEVEVLQWFVKEGEPVKQFQNVCEVQSDKATVEITSRYDGVITKIHYKAGEMAKVGSTLIDLDVDEATAASVHDSAKPAQSRKSPSPVSAASPTPTPKPVPVPVPMAEVKQTPAPIAQEQPSVISQTRSNGDEKILTSPSVRRLAREHNIDLLDIEGTGPQGRILKEDLLEYIRVLAAAPPVAIPASASVVTASSASSISIYLEEDTVVPLTPIQKMMVKSMNAALKVPHFGYADEIEVDALYKLRDDLKPVALERGLKLSFMPFIIKAASLALKYHPSLNATVSGDETYVTMVAAHNISVAMDTPTGLIVPNIKNVESKSLLEIAADLNRLQQLASAGKLSIADLTGGTFSYAAADRIARLLGTSIHEVFASLLEFLYTDEVSALKTPNVDVDFLLELMTLADQYLVEALKSRCETALFRDMSVHNVCQLFQAAHFSEAYRLKRRCLAFILDRFGEVIATQSFVSLPQPLLQEVLLVAARNGVAIPNQNRIVDGVHDEEMM